MDEQLTHARYFDEDPASAVEAVEGILSGAASAGASDIHIDPSERDIAVRFRCDGELAGAGMLPLRLHEEAIARLKIMCGARTDLHSVPQDGRFEEKIAGKRYNARVSFMPTYHGENAVIRLLPTSADTQDSFAALGFTPEHVLAIVRALDMPNGLILVTGPTGSGKTTTLRVCLGLKASSPLSVMTLEDPVEYEVPGVRHVHIRREYGVTFASGLRAALRQDPDVIMVGEIRDEETARTAIHTALTGHLVLSTLHTTSALGAVTRLAEMGIEPYLIAATLRLVIGQRLVRRTCAACAGDGASCMRCQGMGLSGRAVICETLEADAALREAIARRAPPGEIQELARAHGMKEMAHDAAQKIEWGMTTPTEALRALSC